MRLPTPASPIARRGTIALDRSAALAPSDCCGAGKTCLGTCIPFINVCAGLCI